MTCRILFLAADPDGKLSLSEEVHSIEANIQLTEHRDSLQLISNMAVRTSELLNVLNRYKPHVVHFSAMGRKNNKIILIGQDGLAKPVSEKALTSLFKTRRDNIRLVVLNSCFSHSQAKAIVEHIDCAVGMSDRIPDQTARSFSAAFYQALGYGHSVHDAFEEGKTAILLEGLPEGDADLPELLTRQGVDAETVFLAGQSGKPAEPGRSDNGPDVSGEGKSAKVTNAPRKAENSKAIDLWREKLTYFLVQEATVSDPSQKFTLRKQIQEALEKLRELGG